jgi:DNA repair protein RadC
MQEPAHCFSGVREAMSEAAPAPSGSPLAGSSAPLDEAAHHQVTLPEDIRPRSRLREAGAEALSAAELLALILCAYPDTSEEGALDLAVGHLCRRGGLHGLLRSSPPEVSGVAGVGEAKAQTILAAAELGKRMVLEPAPERPVISSPGDVDRLLRPRMAHLDRERFVALLLNTKYAVIGTHTVSIGTLSSSLVHPREVFKPAIQEGAAAVILAHNHPSGRVEPSREDRAVTTRVVEAGETIGIEVLDHVIIGEAHFSFKERGFV